MPALNKKSQEVILRRMRDLGLTEVAEQARVNTDTPGVADISQQPTTPAADDAGDAPDAEYPGDDPDRKDRASEFHRDLIQDVIRKAADLKRAGVIDAKTMADAVAHARKGEDEAHAAVGRLDQYEAKGQPDGEPDDGVDPPADAPVPPSDPPAEKPVTTKRLPRYPGDAAEEDRWRRWEMAHLSAANVDKKFRYELARMLTGGERERTGDLSRAERKRRVEIALRLEGGALKPKFDTTGALSVVDPDGDEVDPWDLPGREVAE
jgi:hypothetical protein